MCVTDSYVPPLTPCYLGLQACVCGLFVLSWPPWKLLCPKIQGWDSPAFIPPTPSVILKHMVLSIKYPLGEIYKRMLQRQPHREPSTGYPVQQRVFAV